MCSSKKRLLITTYNLVPQRSELPKPERKCFLKIVHYYTYPIHVTDKGTIGQASKTEMTRFNSFGEQESIVFILVLFK